VTRVGQGGQRAREAVAHAALSSQP
jgi:hypothetical protein